MKIVQVVPRQGTDANFKAMLKETERPTSVARTPRSAACGRASGSTSEYPGWISSGTRPPGGLLLAENQTKLRDHEWQLLHAFIGYLDRHLGDQIDSIAVNYR